MSSHVVAPLDDLYAQQRHLCHRSFNLPGAVARISRDKLLDRALRPSDLSAEFEVLHTRTPKRGGKYLQNAPQSARHLPKIGKGAL
jgi:hypothetical protein